MNRKNILIIFFSILISILLTSCSTTSEDLQSEINALNNEISKLKSENEQLKEENNNLKIEYVDSFSNENEVETIESQEESNSKDVQSIIIGETVINKYFEFTLNKVELTYKLEPDNPPSFYTYYEADPGQVYVHVDADIKNTAKQGLDADAIYSVEVDYNNGYNYKGFTIVESKDGNFTYASITRVDPLQTLGVHTLVDCPEEIDNDKSSPLKVIITLSDNTQYEYIIR